MSFRPTKKNSHQSPKRKAKLISFLSHLKLFKMMTKQLILMSINIDFLFKYHIIQSKIKSQMIACEIEDLDRKEKALIQNLNSAQKMIADEAESCLSECDSIRKNIIKKLSENLQDLSDKNVNLFSSLRKINERFLGIKKLDEASVKSVSSIMAKNDLKLSRNSKSDFPENDSNLFQKPPRQMKNLIPKKVENNSGIKSPLIKRSRQNSVEFNSKNQMICKITFK